MAIETTFDHQSFMVIKKNSTNNRNFFWTTTKFFQIMTIFFGQELKNLIYKINNGD
jgi:hypothetical protein